MKSFVKLIILSLLLFNGYCLQAQKIDEVWLKALNEGKEAYSAARYAGALESFRKAAQIVPTDTTAYIFMIDCAFKLKKPPVLYSCIEKLELIDFHNAWMYRMGIMMARDVQKDFDKAGKYLEKAKQLYPANRDIQAEEIRTLYVKEDYKNTKQKIQQFLSLYKQGYPQLTILLHILFEIDKNYPEVLSVLRGAIREYPDSMYLSELEANVYLMKGEIETAKLKFEEIIQHDPRDPKAYYNLARIYYEREDGKNAVEYSEKAIAIDSLFVDAIYNLGTYYYYWGLSYNQAISEMSPEQYVEQSREIGDSAIYFLKLAKPYFEKVIRLRPDELDAYENLNTINVLLGNLAANLMASAELKPRMEPEKERLAEKEVKNEGLLSKLGEKSGVMADIIAMPELEIHGLRVDYPPGDTSGLHKGEIGSIHFVIANKGLARAGGLEAVIMEPVSIPEIEYNSTLSIKALTAGDSTEVLIPLKYLPNNAHTTGIEKMANLANKLRIFVKDSTGTSSGLHELTVLLSRGAANRSNYSETEDIVFNPYTGGRNFLLIIAIDDYQHWPKLANAVSDARSVKEVLLKKYRFIPDFLYELYNSDASKDKVRNTLIKIKQDITGNDNLVIYYAGHGDYNSDFNEGAWIPYDAKLNIPDDYLSNSTLLSYLRSLQSKHIFLIADACFSGSLFVTDSEVSYQEYNDKLKSRWALSSGNMEYVADGTSGTHSPFARFLVQALNDNKRDRISVSELVSYVKLMVKNATQQSPVGKPLRVPGNEGGDYVFYTK